MIGRLTPLLNVYEMDDVRIGLISVSIHVGYTGMSVFNKHVAIGVMRQL